MASLSRRADQRTIVSGPVIAVAVAHSPFGPFRMRSGIHRSTFVGIDPTIFIDDDGQAYLYWGNPSLWYVKLDKDMIS